MVDSEFEDPKALTKMQLDNKNEIADMQNETQKEIAGILFFFQAEDGIRDHCVTGVQTCALPIWLRTTVRAVSIRCSSSARARTTSAANVHSQAGPGSTVQPRTSISSSAGGTRLRRRLSKIFQRSEERRVGKEGRSRWATCH